MFTAGCKASGPPGPPLHPPWNPWNIQLSQGTGQGVSMTFNAASRLRSLEDRSAALGSSRCELPGMHSVPKSAVLPYASGVGGLSRRLLIYTHMVFVFCNMLLSLFKKRSLASQKLRNGGRLSLLLVQGDDGPCLLSKVGPHSRGLLSLRPTGLPILQGRYSILMLREGSPSG